MLTTAKLLEQQLAQAGMLTFAILWLLIIYFPYALEHSLQYSCLNNLSGTEENHTGLK